MKKILVTGGTVFVSKYVAEYFAKKGNEVYVLNRNTKAQPAGTHLICADRHQLGDTLKGYRFDAVLDITGYNEEDVAHLVDGLAEIKQYIFISSSAVYPETLPQPFKEEQECGPNAIWGAYGTNKLAAEKYLTKHVPQAYILRPPYLYGPMQNLYREPFVFDCANQDRPFYVPKDGKMPLHFFYIDDLCRFMEILLEKQPAQRIFNVGNPETVSINEWVDLCYQAAGKKAKIKNVYGDYGQREYFCFHDYGYVLDVTAQNALMPETKSLPEGLRESYQWYMEHEADVAKRNYVNFIEENLQ